MKLALIYKDAAMPSSRVRVLEAAPHYRALGHACECLEAPDGPLALRRLLRRIEGADLVLIQKRFPSLLEAALWRRARVPLVYDIDDAVMLRQRPRDGSYDSPGRMRRFHRTLALCDGVVCGNAYLAGFARDSRIPLLIAPSPVPLEVPVHVPREAGDGAPLRIGWIGTRSNLASLQPLVPVLRELARRRAVRLCVISDTEFAAEGLRVENVPWSAATQARELARLDVGIMPMEDTPWSRGKCSYKLLQYMAAGVAAVASPVGMNAEVVRHGENGLLASASGDWLAALERLCAEGELRARLGRAGRATAVSEFGCERFARRCADFFGQVLASARSRSGA